MDCGADTIEIQEPDGTMRGIEIIPEGCQAVSEDVCKSGYMAPTENISFPEDSLKQCCKCKEGESCQFCKNPDACTEEEKDEFVTSEKLFWCHINQNQNQNRRGNQNQNQNRGGIEYKLLHRDWGHYFIYPLHYIIYP